METLSSCLIWQIISCILPPNEYGCVYTSLSEPAIDLQKMPILAKKKNHLFKRRSFWSPYTHLGYRKHARIHWKADANKSSHCLVRILVQRHNCASFLRKWASRDRYSQTSVIGPYWTNFCWQKLKRRILATFGFNRAALSATQPKLHSMFCTLFLKIALSQPQNSCRLATSQLRFDIVVLLFVGSVKDKCYADKPETIDALKDNNCEAIGEIQLAYNR